MTEDTDMTRQDEAVTAAEFDLEEAREPDFGNWPEIVGALVTALIIWASFAFRG